MQRARKYSSWFQNHKTDLYVRLSKEQNLRARSAFKLEEIQKGHRILKPGQFVVKILLNIKLDCGACPGGWSIVASKCLDLGKHKESKLIAVDLLGNISLIS